MTSPVVLVSNRGPVSFTEIDGRLVAKRGGGGLVSGLAPLVAGTDATWIAAALSDGDRTAAGEGVIDAADMKVRTLAIEPMTLRLAYDVVCNSTLWFLYHGLHDLSRRPVFDRGWAEAWQAYRDYNQRFAGVIAADAPADATVLVQDYHLALLGPRLAEARPDLATVHFSHTPFAPPHLLRVLPTDAAIELLEGMTGHTICGFHSPRWAADFRASCRELLGRDAPTFVAPLAPDPDDLRGVAAGDACPGSVRRARRPSRRLSGDRAGRSHRTLEEPVARLPGLRSPPPRPRRPPGPGDLPRARVPQPRRPAGVPGLPPGSRGPGRRRQPSLGHRRLDADRTRPARRFPSFGRAPPPVRRVVHQPDPRRSQPRRQGRARS